MDAHCRRPSRHQKARRLAVTDLRDDAGASTQSRRCERYHHLLRKRQGPRQGCPSDRPWHQRALYMKNIPATPRRVETVAAGEDVIGTDNRPDLDVVHLEHLRRHIKVHDVTGCSCRRGTRCPHPSRPAWRRYRSARPTETETHRQTPQPSRKSVGPRTPRRAAGDQCLRPVNDGKPCRASCWHCNSSEGHLRHRSPCQGERHRFPEHVVGVPLGCVDDLFHGHSPLI